MNERILELAIQAREYAESMPDIYKVAYDKKFSELIVKECIQQASIGNMHGNNQWDKALTFAADNIKKHFGVEE
jgi:hypothetical protein